MSTPQEQHSAPANPWPAGVGFGCLGGFGLVVMMLFMPEVEHLLFGWIGFAVRGLAGSSFDVPTMLAGLIAAAGFVIGGHCLLRWLNRSTTTSQPRSWRARTSVGLALVVILLFISGTAVVGLVHQVSWLATTDRQIYVTGQTVRSESLIGLARLAAYQSNSKGHLKMIGLAMHNYADETGSSQFPPGGIYDAAGRGFHGWMTLILPQMFFDSRGIALNKPWTAPENVPYFQSPIMYYWNPALSQQYDERGFALAHYAGNIHILYPNSPGRLMDVRDGRSQTILSGEVNEAFEPWGSPSNFRDPARGINKGNQGFGSAARSGGANMLFVDGSVRMLSEDIDETVLRALSTPAGDDHVDGFD